MIDPNNPKPGRNEPCPCGKVGSNGKPLKYKLCCGDAEIKALREDHIRMKILAHLFLTQLQKLTGAKAVTVPDDVLRSYPADHRIAVVRDKDKGLFRFAAEQPEQPLVESPRRILLPR